MDTRPKAGTTVDAYEKCKTKQVFSPRRVECKVTNTYQYYDKDGNIRTIYMYKGLPYEAENMYGFPNASSGDLNVVW